MEELKAVKTSVSTRDHLSEMRSESQKAAELKNSVTPSSLLQTCSNFFYERCHQIIEQKDILISRWQYLCRSRMDVLKYHESFAQAQNLFLTEYGEYMTRYERLSGAIQQQKELQLELDTSRVCCEINLDLC